MTMDEEKIYDLYMNQHLTTQQIADQLGYNRNGVKNFIYKKGWKRRFIKKCVVCGKEFETDRERNKFCSEECHKKQVAKDDVKYHRPKSGMRVCENCGKEYYYNENVPSYYKSENQKTGVNAARFCCYECGREFGLKKEQKTNLEKYGHECSVHGEEIKEKVKKTLMENYGVEYTFQSKEIREKTKNSCLERYGVDNILKSKEFREQARKTNLEKYGVENVFASKEIQDKIKKTNLKKYGVVYPIQSEVIKKKLNFASINEKSFETKKKNGTFRLSHLEIEVKNFVESLGFHTEKFIIGKDSTRFEIDVYIPELQKGIEFNGCWFHSQNINRFKTMNSHDTAYHFNKYLTAKEKGIDLIQIWEDQWLLKREIIEDILKARLGVISKDHNVYARNCRIEEIDNKIYKQFCEKNHIQGYRSAEVKLGLYYGKILVQIASFDKCKDYGKRKSQAEWEWIRGCPASNNSVIGGTSKLFSYFVRCYNPESVLCYADCNLFDGKGYEKCGFEFTGYTGPDKFYIENNTFKRHARNPYKYKQYKQLVEENKLFECYGAGSLRFMWRKDEE